MIAISVISPVWREEARTLDALHERLTRVLGRVAASWEILLVADGCHEPTLRVLRALRDADTHVKLVVLPRRLGQQAAVVAGLLQARGDLLCTIDCDLENRPEDLPRLLASLEQGYDLVLGRRAAPAAARWRRCLSRWHTGLMNRRWDCRLEDWGCGLNAGRRAVFEGLRATWARWQMGPLKASLVRQARRWTQVEVARDPRPYGRSGYAGWHLCWFAARMLLHGHTGPRRR
jgi:undecaprenyl-phosphate 4-deoxy-4-formamido-L-arabinose transferase